MSDITNHQGNNTALVPNRINKNDKLDKNGRRASKSMGGMVALKGVAVAAPIGLGETEPAIKTNNR